MEIFCYLMEAFYFYSEHNFSVSCVSYDVTFEYQPLSYTSLRYQYELNMEKKKENQDSGVLWDKCEPLTIKNTLV